MNPFKLFVSRIFLVVGLLGSAVLLVSCGGGGDGKIVLRFGHSANDSDIWHKSALYFADQVTELSMGHMEVKVFPSEQLGKELEMIRSIQSEVMDMTVSGESMQNWTPYAAFCGLPYLLDDLDDLNRVASGSAGEKIESEIQEKVGLKALGYFARGPRHLTSNRPIRTPADLKGIILRVPSVPISIAVWDALGAKSTPMALSEVFTSLQSGAIEAQENPLALINSAGFYEVQKYVDLTRHVVGWVYVLIGQKQFDALSSSQQKILVEAGQRMQAYHQKLLVEEEATLRKTLEARGMQMVEVDVDAFKAIADKAVAKELPKEILSLYRKIKDDK